MSGGTNGEVVLPECDSSPIAVKQQSWNHPRHNTYRTLAALWSFTVIGIANAAIGALIPYLRTYYNLTYTIVALIFIPNLLGSLIATSTNHSIHQNFGQRGIAIIGPICQILAFAVISLHPPFPVVFGFLILAGVGGYLQDGAYNAFVGNLEYANEVLGLLHGLYGAGAIVGPLLVTFLVTKAGMSWFVFFYCMVVASSTCLIASTLAFWTSDGPTFRQTHHPPSSPSILPSSPSILPSPLSPPLNNILSTPNYRHILLFALLFLFLQGGLEDSIGGWIITLMLQSRHTTPFASGIIGTLFWSGFTLGRISLSFLTSKLGPRTAVTVYMLITAILGVVFWCFPGYYWVEALCVALVGYFLGPLYPTALGLLAKLLPGSLHVSVMGMAATAGSVGSTIFPFLVGALAQDWGGGGLGVVAAGLLCAEFMVWLWFPSERGDVLGVGWEDDVGGDESEMEPLLKTGNGRVVGVEI